MVSGFYQLSSTPGFCGQLEKVPARRLAEPGSAISMPLARFPGDSVELPGAINRLSCCKPMRD